MKPLLSSILAVVLTGSLQAQGDFSVLAYSRDYPEPSKIFARLARESALLYLDERKRVVDAFTTASEIENRGRYTRARLLEALGALPERTPLNPRVTGVLERDGYRVEKVVYESRPGFFVTASFYLPTIGSTPFPGVLFPLGHESGGKANEDWQHLAITLARNGFAVLAYDPIGQGERIQLYDPAFGGSKVLESTSEHTIAGVQCLLLGHAFMQHRLWDGIRALDYLESRPEVDSKRLACTGNSGGGTMTAHLAAVDDRIGVAVPSCYITSWRNLLETIGPQDAEQSTPPLLAAGINHADLVMAFAPKPYLIASAIRDFFPIAGARGSFREARRAYEILGRGDRIQMVEADDGHGYTLPRRRAAYRWLSRWLKGVEEPIEETGINLELQEDLNCTDSGQVAVSLDARSIFSFHQEDARRMEASRSSSRSGTAETLVEKARQLSGYTPPVRPLKVRRYGEIGRRGYDIQRLLFESAPGSPVPALLFVPGRAAQGALVLYVHEAGKEAEAMLGGDLEDLVEAGNTVLAIDLLGTGETGVQDPLQRSGSFFRYFGDYDSAMTLLLAGRPLLGLRVRDVIAAVDVLLETATPGAAKLTAVGRGLATLPLLHAAAFDQRIGNLVLEDPLVSYGAVIEEKVHWQVFEAVIPGVLQHYDVPGLAAVLAPRPLRVVSARDARWQRLPLPAVQMVYQPTLEAYAQKGASSGFQVLIRKPNLRLSELCPDLLGQQEGFEP